VTDHLAPFTDRERELLERWRDEYARGLRCEFDQWDAGEPWVCLVGAAYVGPPSTRVEPPERRA
jgi:hypothetical protein